MDFCDLFNLDCKAIVSLVFAAYFAAINHGHGLIFVQYGELILIGAANVSRPVRPFFCGPWPCKARVGSCFIQNWVFSEGLGMKIALNGSIKGYMGT